MPGTVAFYHLLRAHIYRSHIAHLVADYRLSLSKSMARAPSLSGHQANRIRCESFIGDPFSVCRLLFSMESRSLQRRIAGSILGVIGMLYLHAVRIFALLCRLRPASVAFDKLKSVFVCVYPGAFPWWRG